MNSHPYPSWPFGRSSTIPFLLLLFFFIILQPHGHAEVVLEGSLGPAGAVGSGNLPDGTHADYLITDGLGTRAGNNLFHSFSEFGIETGKNATFTGPDVITNVIGRVTGGNVSNIDGLLRSTINDANLYLLNPNGIFFGPNATLDVKGSFHVSTADYLRFEDGGTLYANPVETSVLSVASISAFGFLSDHPAGITIEESALAVPDGETLSLIGGDIEITGDSIKEESYSNLLAPGGRINIASVAKNGEVYFNSAGEEPDLRMEQFNTLGTIDISRCAFIDSRGDPGGNIIIRGGNFFLTESVISAATQGEQNHPGIGVDVEIAEEMILMSGELDAAEISSSSFGIGNAGNIRIEAGKIKMIGDPHSMHIAAIASRVFNSGNSGNVYIKTDDLQMNENSGIIGQVFGSGKGGHIEIKTDSLAINGGRTQSLISSSTFDSGGAGNLNVNAKDVTIYGGKGGFTGLASQVSSRAFGEANAGSLTLITERLQLLNGAQINAAVFAGAGRAGDLNIIADTVHISGTDASSGAPAGIFSDIGNYAMGVGGDINIEANDIEIFDGGQINVFSWSFGDSGNIKVQTNAFSLQQDSFFSSANFGMGKAGNIYLDAESVFLKGPNRNGFTGLVALAGVFSTGAGNINVRASNLDILDGAQINAQTSGTGRGGDINVIADNIHIEGIDPGSGSACGPNAGIYTSSLVYENYVKQATGRAGDIDINANRLSMKDHGTISALTTSAGDGGDIDIIVGDTLLSDGSFVTTAADQAHGGDITIMGNGVELLNNTLVSAKSSGPGDAGNIAITANDSYISRDSAVITEAGQADGGNIQLNSQKMIRLIDSEVSASVGGGPESIGGNIGIDPEFVILDGSMILANAYEGTGGNIDIAANVFLADPESVVDASSALGIDGNVDIRAPVKEISSSLRPLNKDFRSAVALLREPCTARLEKGKYSSFIISGRDGLPIEPGGLLPSPLY